MSGNEKKQLVRHYYEKVVSTGNIDIIGDYISRDYVEVYRNRRHLLGVKGATDHVLGVRRTYPDLHLIVEQQISEADWVVTHVTARGTHLGTWLGIKPTGCVLEFTAVNVDKVVDGRIVEHSGAANILEPLLDAGAIRVVRD